MSTEPAEADLQPYLEAARLCACLNFRKASRAVTQHFDEVLAPANVRSTQLVVLLALRVYGPCSVAHVARELVMDRSTLTRNLRPLIERGLVSSEKAPGGRTQRVALSAAGRAALDTAVPLWKQAQDGLMDAFGRARWGSLISEINAVVATLHAAAR